MTGFNNDGTDRYGCIGLDAPRVTRDEAVELCVHHLQMAAMYFEGTPDDCGTQLLEEAARVSKRGHAPAYQPPALAGATAFIKALTNHYELLKKDD